MSFLVGLSSGVSLLLVSPNSEVEISSCSRYKEENVRRVLFYNIYWRASRIVIEIMLEVQIRRSFYIF